MTKNKRYIDGEEECVEDQFLIDTKTDDYFFINHGLDEIVKRLNEQEELIERLKQIREEQIKTILKQKVKIKELEEENGRMKGAFKRKFDYDIEDVVDEICDEDW